MSLSRWVRPACSVTILLAVAACAEGDGSSDRTPAPPGVPGSARLLGKPEEFGAADTTPAGTNAGEERLFFSTSCADDVLAVVTTQEVFYAELPCDRAVPQDVAERFLGLPVRVRIVPSDPGKLFVESDAAGSLEFTVGRVWIVPVQ